jgi:integrase
VLRAAINLAHRNGRLTWPVALELPERPEPKERWLSRKEAAAIIRAARTPQARLYLPHFILIGLYTGRRKEAILSLRWPQVNLEARTINFDIGGRKRTNKKRGIIPIPPRLLPHLHRLRKRGTDLGYVLHINGERIKDIKKGFAAACDRAGIADVTPHTLKHTAASLCNPAPIRGRRRASSRRASRRCCACMVTIIRITSGRQPRTSENVRRMSAQSCDVVVAFHLRRLRWPMSASL